MRPTVGERSLRRAAPGGGEAGLPGGESPCCPGRRPPGRTRGVGWSMPGRRRGKRSAPARPPDLHKRRVKSGLLASATPSTRGGLQPRRAPRSSIPSPESDRPKARSRPAESPEASLTRSPRGARAAWARTCCLPSAKGSAGCCSAARAPRLLFWRRRRADGWLSTFRRRRQGGRVGPGFGYRYQSRTGAGYPNLRPIRAKVLHASLIVFGLRYSGLQVRRRGLLRLIPIFGGRVCVGEGPASVPCCGLQPPSSAPRADTSSAPSSKRRSSTQGPTQAMKLSQSRRPRRLLASRLHPKVLVRLRQGLRGDQEGRLAIGREARESTQYPGADLGEPAVDHPGAAPWGTKRRRCR